MTTPTAESLEAAREWCQSNLCGYKIVKYDSPATYGWSFFAESIAALLDAHSAPLRAEIERLKDQASRMAEELSTCSVIEERAEAAEAEVERLLFTSDKQAVAWKERALSAEERVRVLEAEAKHLRAINDALNDKTQLLFEQLEAAEKS